MWFLCSCRLPSCFLSFSFLSFNFLYSCDFIYFFSFPLLTLFPYHLFGQIPRASISFSFPTLVDFAVYFPFLLIPHFSFLLLFLEYLGSGSGSVSERIFKLNFSLCDRNTRLPIFVSLCSPHSHSSPSFLYYFLRYSSFPF